MRGLVVLMLVSALVTFAWDVGVDYYYSELDPDGTGTDLQFDGGELYVKFAKDNVAVMGSVAFGETDVEVPGQAERSEDTTAYEFEGRVKVQEMREDSTLWIGGIYRKWDIDNADDFESGSFRIYWVREVTNSTFEVYAEYGGAESGDVDWDFWGGGVKFITGKVFTNSDISLYMEAAYRDYDDDGATNEDAEETFFRIGIMKKF